MSTSVNPWWEFDQTLAALRLNTLDRLKAIINGLNFECGSGLSKSGRKQEILERIQECFDSFKSKNDVDRWQKARGVVHQVRNSGTWVASRITTTGFHAASANGAYAQARARPQSPMTSTNSGVSHPYSSTSHPSTSTIPAAPSRPVIPFKPSPFFRAEKTVSNIVDCPESHTPADRRTGTVSFTLTPEQWASLSAPGSVHQLRLYCTSSTYYGSYRNNQELCLIEFPPTCEVRVNGATLINANLKGLKKKPGTAPPANLGGAVKLNESENALKPNQVNRVEMVYVNSTQNTPAKKYYIVVQLVEITTVEQLVDRLRKGKYRDSASIVQSMKAQAAADDDDIVAGPQKMSLRDSLTLCRVSTPCRSSRCVHPQCFDAATWFSMMEQTTTWLCPICEKVLNPDELVVDGYFENILKETPEAVEDVVVEADGEWHTSDNQYASPTWKASHSSMPPPAIPSVAKRSVTPKPAPRDMPRDEILVVDSDEEDEEGQVKRQLSHGFRDNTASANSSFNGTMPPASRSATPIGASAVIDLTLSDSEDDTPVLRQRTAPPLQTQPIPFPIPVATIVNPTSATSAPDSSAGQKRKATDDQTLSDNAWKKSRPSDYPPAANGHNGVQYPPSGQAPNGTSTTGRHVSSPPIAGYSGAPAYTPNHRDPPPHTDERYSRYRSPPRAEGAYGVYTNHPQSSGPPYHPPPHSSRTNGSSNGYRNGYPYSSSSSSRPNGSPSTASGRW